MQSAGMTTASWLPYVMFAIGYGSIPIIFIFLPIKLPFVKKSRVEKKLELEKQNSLVELQVKVEEK